MIRHIILAILLCAFQQSLAAMELTLELSTPPANNTTLNISNSSSEMCFFIKHIDHNLSQCHHLNDDAKKELLKKYIAATNDERRASCEYDKLIDIPDYMNLSKNNKCSIQMLCSAGTPMRIDDINNNKMIVLTAFPNSQIDYYQKMLKLPQHIRRKITTRYSRMIIVTGPEQQMNPDQIGNKELIEMLKSCSINAGIIATTTTILDYFLAINIPNPFIAIPLFSAMTALEILIFTKGMDAMLYPLTRELKYRYHDGYKLQPLLPEENKK